MQSSTATVPAERIREILIESKKKYGQAPLERLEDAFLRSIGARERAVSSHPLQRPTFYYPGLETEPWFNPDRLEGIAILESNWEAIRDEVLAVREVGYQSFEDGTPHDGTWGALHFRYGGRPVERNRDICPRTLEVVNSLPRIGEMAMVSALTPGARIKPHCGVSNFRLTAHLGLQVPVDCGFRVADEVRHWEEGKCLLFDDSFEHETWNDSKETRFVLLVDFWHPDLTPVEIEVLDQIVCLMASLRSRLNEGVGELQGKVWWM